MSVFKFRHFNILQADNPMKVGTDAMILGSIIDASGKTRGLDIGAGTGVLSLMIAQRNPAIEINAVEIDDLASTECQSNFDTSPWEERLSVHSGDFLDFTFDETFDLIFSNPPYYQTRNENLEHRKAAARHESSLPMKEMVTRICELLTDQGDFWVIVPSEVAEVWFDECRNAGLFINLAIDVTGKEEGPVKRIILRASADKKPEERRTLTIRNTDGEYTKAYKELTRNFHDREV